MRVSIEWLKEFVEINIPLEDLAEKMTMSGITVEAIEDQAAKYRGMVVARILSLEKHPQADNLLITQVDAGEHGKKQVITAAKNLNEGDLVPLALPGTTLPNEKLITEVQFKGVLSSGMLCSGEELGLEKQSSGIWVFSSEYALGSPVAVALGENDHVFVLELTANRPDCLGMIGVAREVAAILGTTYRTSSTELKEEGDSIQGQAFVKIADPDLCLRYTARVARDITIKPSPQWMQRRLKAAGVRPISNLVDITNYVMLEYNQPLHAFDLDRIDQHQIIVRRAKPAEKLVTLDEVERQFNEDNLLITDPSSPLCVAGVMGGSTSEVTNQTVNILLESAYFNPMSIRKTAKTLEMRTESSLRFERGIDPNGALTAVNRAAYLIELLDAGKVAKGWIDEYPQKINPVVVKTSTRQINGWLGTDIPENEVCEILKRVNFEVTQPDDQHIEVKSPTYRRDIFHMADLAEEVARIYGYHKIPVTLPVNKDVGERTRFQKYQHELRRLLQGSGFSEVITYSLYASDTGKKLNLPESDPLNKTVDLMVPLSEDQAVMRTTLADGMLKTLAFNNKRRQSNLFFYEMARVYLSVEGTLLPNEPLHLSLGMSGQLRDTGWNQPQNEVDFYDLKGMLELITDNLANISLERSERPYLHPGQSAEIMIDGTSIGYLGQVHPAVAAEYELNRAAYLMELNLSAIEQTGQPDTLYKPLPRFPAVERDLALVLPLNIPPQQVIAQIKEFGGELVEQVQLFDVYQGEQVPEGQRSLAFSLSYRSKERTLNDTEVTQLQQELLQKLHKAYGAVIRD